MKYDIWSKYYQFGGDTESRGADEITIEVILIQFLKRNSVSIFLEVLKPEENQIRLANCIVQLTL